jgi:hypothetical protein
MGNDDEQYSGECINIFNPSSTTYVKHFIIELIILILQEIIFQHHFVAGYCNVTAAIMLFSLNEFR